MPRIGRLVAPNMPHHVVQRGHNRNTVFVDEGDFSYYLDTLREWSQILQVKVYAWCLMTNGQNWTPARDLRVGDLVQLASNSSESIDGVELSRAHKKVFNLTVNNNHNYYVGEVAVLVHKAQLTGTYTHLDARRRRSG